MEVRDIADFIADAEVFPGPLVDKSDWFGLLMSSERIVQRKARRRVAEYTMMAGTRVVPYEIFRAASFSGNQAEIEFNGYNLSLERRANNEQYG